MENLEVLEVVENGATSMFAAGSLGRKLAIGGGIVVLGALAVAFAPRLLKSLKAKFKTKRAVNTPVDVVDENFKS